MKAMERGGEQVGVGKESRLVWGRRAALIDLEAPFPFWDPCQNTGNLPGGQREPESLAQSVLSITSAPVLFKRVKLTHGSQRRPKPPPASENLDAEPLGSSLLIFYCKLRFTTSKMGGAWGISFN